MKTSNHFRYAFFYKQSRSSKELFAIRRPSLFVGISSPSWIDAYVESHEPLHDAEISSAFDALSGTTADGGYRERKQGLQRSDSSAEESSSSLSSGDVNAEKLRLSSLPTTRVSESSQLETLVLQSSGRNRILWVRAFDQVISTDCVSLIRQRHSFSALSVSPKLFACLMRTCTVFGQFKDFVLCFGSKTGDYEVGPPRIRFRLLSADLPAISSGFECAYVLRFVELNHRGRDDPWSVRQTGVYHKYSTLQQASTWLFLNLTTRFEEHLQIYIRRAGQISQLNPFEIHVLLLDTAIVNWRQYLLYLVIETNKQSEKVDLAFIGEGPIQITDYVERQKLKVTEDSLLDVVVMLESTLNTICTLLDSYSSFVRMQSTFSTGTTDAASDDIYHALDEKRGDVKLLQAKVEAIREKVAGTTKLLSGLLDLGNGHSLKQLAEEARLENTTMRRLTEKSTMDAAAVKVLTVLTLIYLPATVVSNFFSTSFVGTEIRNGVTQVFITPDVWIFVASSVPLTLLTLYIWWYWVQKQLYGKFPPWLGLPAWFDLLWNPFRTHWLQRQASRSNRRKANYDHETGNELRIAV